MNRKSKFTLGLLAAISILTLALAACSPAAAVSAAPSERFGEPGGRGGQGTGSGVAPQDGTGTSQTWQGRGGSGQSRGSGAAQTGSGYALTPLSEAEINALEEAVLEEYGALNLYTSIKAQFGSVYPFDVIAKSEQQHVNALLRQAEKYGVEMPAQPAAAATTFASLADACAAGAAAEIADAALYDELKLVTERTDLLQVFNNLQKASLESHLPAFEACK